ncbi:hypothetical protein DFR28_105135 [Arenicella xantha]|uniref:Uncharacterized protein n=1 Tax=Arenicella xantha TaxID=644221 RepID=A0A395JG11_9GAMM|nr:hypothetical protein DFR28_105135 [Arenicella xantha]
MQLRSALYMFMTQYEPPLKIPAILKFAIVLAGVILAVSPLFLSNEQGVLVIHGLNFNQEHLGWLRYLAISSFFLIGISLLLIYENIRFSISLFAISIFIPTLVSTLHSDFHFATNWPSVLIGLSISLVIIIYEFRRLKKNV